MTHHCSICRLPVPADESVKDGCCAFCLSRYQRLYQYYRQAGRLPFMHLHLHLARRQWRKTPALDALYGDGAGG